MGVKVLARTSVRAAVLAMGMVGPLSAQSLDQVGGPSNPPPAGYKGQQFIDSRGCVFVRAGFGGTVNWVPRIDGRKRPICGMLPTGAAPAPQVAEAAPTAPEAPRPGLFASLFAPQPGARTASPSPAPAPTVLPAPQVAAAAPVAPRGPGLLALLFAPRPVAVQPAAQPVVQPAVQPAAQEVVVSFSQPARTLPVPPKGWHYAWKDGRLNPLRGVGTAAGQAQQDRLYTQEVPMVFLADLPPKEQAKRAAKPRVTVATASEPAQPRVTVATSSDPAAAAGGIMVQVGCFGDPGNAERALGRIYGLGLPVARGKANGLTVVMAGPFASASEAEAGLSALRAAGFGDAFLR